MHWITEEAYEEQMRREAEPYLAARRESGFVERVKGQPVYYEHYRADEPHAVIVISHGFTESLEKFAESIYYMLQAGYEVWAVEHRGHGRSFRLNDNPYVVHTERFEHYVLDLKYLTETLVKPAAGALPVYLFAHSMGGCIGAWMIETYPELFRKAVLSSPMMGLDFGKFSPPAAYVVLGLRSLGGKGKEPMSPVTGFREEPNFAESCGSSECRFLYYHKKRVAEKKFQTSSASQQWIRESIKACARVTSRKETAKIQIPVLLCQAGADTVVKNEAQDLFVSRVKGCEKFLVPGLRHELYMSDSPYLIPYWEKVFAFLG